MRVRAFALFVTSAFAVWSQAPAVFRIEPRKPLPGLMAEAQRADPPRESGSFRRPDLVELNALDATIRYDIRYATTDNFLSTPVYRSPHAFLQRPAAEALLRAHRRLRRSGFGLLIHDAYRPWWVTKLFWEATPENKRDFVANPSEGSRHNRGCAVDLTLYDLRTGQPVEMPSLYDEMSERAYPTYRGGTPESKRLRDLLRSAMEAEGFSVFPKEWWHFDYRDWKRYPIGTARFEELTGPRH